MNYTKLVVCVLAVLVFSGAGVDPVKPRLQPPWWVFQGRMKATIGADEKCVAVDPLTKVKGGVYDLKIRVLCDDAEKAQGLSTLLSRAHRFARVSVNVRVYNFAGQEMKPQVFPSDAIEAMQLIISSLTGNQYFLRIEDGNVFYDFFVEFKRGVVQFEADNVADAYNNLNEVAAMAFYEVLGLGSIRQMLIGTTTAKS